MSNVRHLPMLTAPRNGTQVWLFHEHAVPAVWEWSKGNGRWERGDGLYWAENDPELCPAGWLPVALEFPAARDVLAERRRQVEVEGWTPEHDDKHEDSSLALAAACYLTPVPLYRVNGNAIIDPWPWQKRVMAYRAQAGDDDTFIMNDGDKRERTSRRQQIVKGLALGLAELERLDRAALADHEADYV